MGGYRSGRTGGLATIEECASLVLSLHEIAEGQRVNIAWHTLSWTVRGEPEPWATVDIRLEVGVDAGKAWLRYDIRRPDRRESRIVDCRRSLFG
jgi:hypothetical protein